VIRTHHRQLFAQVTSLLLADRKWTGLRTVAEIRRERNLTVPYNASSEYVIKIITYSLSQQHL
jgi:hypothetical protein